MTHNRIQYLSSGSIDKQKWDHCIDHSSNGRVYAYSAYLDNMSGKWDALVLGDYEAVMPLTWRRKFGISYLYQPFLTAQLGVFGNGINAELVAEFVAAIPGKFRLVDIYLNSENGIDRLKGFDTRERMNYVLNLQPSYQDLYASYRENIRRNIKKSVDSGCIVQKNIPVDIVIDLAKQQMQLHSKEVDENISRFRKLFDVLFARQQALTYAISLNDQVIASCVFFYSHDRAYYILVGNHANGRTIGASHALIDAFIKDHAGKNMLLDFEGSDIRNLAFFYSSFGATEEKYHALYVNRLPWWIRWMK